MKMHYPKAEYFTSTLTRWNGVDERRDGKPYEVELYSDSDWASCKVTRKSTSSGLIFVNSCCVHSHSRAQMSISLSSMEAEILAATSLLVEGIQLKQLLQYLLGDEGGLSNNAQVQMRLRLDSTSAQGFFNRLGPGRAKHLSTRILWNQQAMRKKWFLVERISTKENPADLNTKPLSRERREYLMKKIGLMSETFNEENFVGGAKVKQIVRVVTAMMMAGNLQGCEGTTWMTSSLFSVVTSPISWTPTAWWTLTTLVLVGVVTYLVNYIKKLKVEMSKYKEAWCSIRNIMNLTDREDPFVQDGMHDARDPHFSGLWMNEETAEEEEPDDDEPVGEAEVAASIERTVRLLAAEIERDREAARPPRIFLENGTHGAADPGEDENPGEEEDAGEPASSSGIHRARPDDLVPTTDEGLEILASAIAEIADGGAERESDDDAWLKETETPEERYRRYVQSEQCEVSDPDEWADVHYGPLSSMRSRSRSRETTPRTTPGTTPDRPVPKAMPKPLAENRQRRLADRAAEEMVQRAEAEQERQGVRQFLPSSGSGATAPSLPTGDNVNYFQDSRAVAIYYGVGLVPRESAAFEDYRWDLIMQGLGPETVLVHNCRELSQYVTECTNLVERSRLQRLLRSLHALLVMFQSKEPQLWIDAVYHVRDWLDTGRDWSFFEEGTTRHGSHWEEGEESERDDDDDIDPQDLPPEEGDRDDDRDRDGADRGGASSSARSTEWDYET
jgi:hypothetical protein